MKKPSIQLHTANYTNDTAKLQYVTFTATAQYPLVLACLFVCTRQHGLVAPQHSEVVHEWGKNPLHGAKHGGEAQIQQHEKEQSRPKWTCRKECHRLCKCYKCQTCALHTLRETETGTTQMDRWTLTTRNNFIMIVRHIWILNMHWNTSIYVNPTLLISLSRSQSVIFDPSRLP